MSRSTCILLAAAMLALSSKAVLAADRWYELSFAQDLSELTFVDITTMKPVKGSLQTATLKTVERNPIVPGNIAMTTTVIDYDCTSSTLQITKFTAYTLEGDVVQTTLAPSTMQTPLKNTRGDLELKFACADPATWDKTRVIDESAVGGSIAEYGRFKLQGMAIDAVDQSLGAPK